MKKIPDILSSILILFLPQIILLCLDKSWSVMVIFLICSLVICLIFFQDKINIFKLGKDGIEFEMKKAIDEAYATIKQMKLLADPLINYSFQLMAGEDRAFHGTSVEERIAFFKKIRNLIIEMDLTTKEIEESLFSGKLSILYAVGYEITTLWSEGIVFGSNPESNSFKEGHEISNQIIEKSQSGFPTGKVNLNIFNEKLKKFPEENRDRAYELYKLLKEFLEETSDIK